MDYQNFIEELTEKVSDFYGESVTVSVREVKKNNNVSYMGLTVLEKGQNVSPTIYLEPFYAQLKKGMEMNEIVSNVIQMNEEHKVVIGFKTDSFLDYEFMKRKIVYKLIHAKKNKELLTRVPYRKFMDLAIVYYCIVEDEKIGRGSILIDHEHMRLWKVDEEELYQRAVLNTPRLLPVRISGMQEVLMEIMDKTMGTSEGILNQNELEDGVNLYILTNSQSTYGAACIMYPDVLEEFSKRIGYDIYILPSSVHEMILVPATAEMNEEWLINMVREVNATEVREEEILSDDIYFFSMQKKEISAIS